MPESELFAEANRQLVICNACRYCEGICPVFRAIETRKDFSQRDIFYLANLCHDCRACYYACMYGPPHEFDLNIPHILSKARIESYKRWSWPSLFARSFTEERITLALIVLPVVAVVLLSLSLIDSNRIFIGHSGSGAFYEVVPYGTMVIAALLLATYVLAIWTQGGMRAWSENTSTMRAGIAPGTAFKALAAALGLTHLHGGGPGCSYPDERPSTIRIFYHSLVFWGFASDFVATSLAFVYEHWRHLIPPYPLLSAPVIFGTVGGLGLIVGTTGLMVCKWKSHRAAAEKRAYCMEYAFLSVLFLVALTGMLTLMLRDTAALGSMLVLHLATVAALFLTMPYGKFVHALYRLLALMQYYGEASTHES